MIGRVGLCLVGCVLCVTPVAADEDVHDGPTAIKPLIVRPRPQQSAPSGQVCDFEHQCYPEKGGPMVTAPAAPPPWLLSLCATSGACLGKSCPRFFRVSWPTLTPTSRLASSPP